MNKKEWLEQENREYRNATERWFMPYYGEFKALFDLVTEEKRNQIIAGMKNRFFGEGDVPREDNVRRLDQPHTGTLRSTGHT